MWCHTVSLQDAWCQVPNASLSILCYENIKAQMVLTVLQVRSILCITKQVLISKTVSTATDQCTSASQTIHYLLQNLQVHFHILKDSPLYHIPNQTNPVNFIVCSIEITNRRNCMQWILFLCLVRSTCFGRHTRPSSGVQLYLQPLVQS